MSDDCATPTSGYYRTDLTEDVLSSLEALSLALAFTARSQRARKWVILAADMLVTSGLVQYNSGSAGVGALMRDSQKHWCEWLDEGSRNEGPVPGQRRVASLPDLLKRSMAPSAFRSSQPLAIASRTEAHVQKLHDLLRNELVHFKPVGWSIQLAGLPDLISAALDVTEAAQRASSVSWEHQQSEEFLRLMLLVRQRLQTIRARVERGSKGDFLADQTPARTCSAASCGD